MRALKKLSPLLLVAGLAIAPTAQATETSETPEVVAPQAFASTWGDNGVEFSTPQSEYCRISEDQGPEGKQFIVCRYGPNPTSIVGVVTGEPATSSEYADLPYVTLDRSEPKRLNPGEQLEVGSGHCAVTELEGTVCGIDNNQFTLPAE